MTLGNSRSDIAIAALPASMAVPVSSPLPCIHRARTVNGRCVRCTPTISQVNGVFRNFGARNCSKSPITGRNGSIPGSIPRAVAALAGAIRGHQTTSGRGKGPRRKSRPLWEPRSAWRSEEHYLGGNRTRFDGSRSLRRGLLRCGNSR
jgi:hypothetical protein